MTGRVTGAACCWTFGAAIMGLWLLTLGFLVTGVWQVLAWRAYGQRVDARPGGTADRAEQIPWSGILTGGCLPPLPGGWQPVGFRTMVRALDSDLGRCSLVWHYSDARDEAVVALDFPFEGWHEPVRVYEVRGWEIESRRLLAEQEFSEPVVEVRMRDASGRRGYLLVRQFTESGVPVAPPADASWSLSEWYRRAGQRVRDRLGEANSTPSTVQVSLLITGDLPLDTTRQAQAQEAFRLATDRIAGILWDKEP